MGGYLGTLRERRWLVLLAVVLTTGIAVLYVLRADKVYEGEAGILVTPVPDTSEILVSVGLISSSVDPLRAVETVARLINTNEVAERAQQMLEGVPEAKGDSEDLLTHVQVTPVAESNIVSVTADAGDPDDAARIANAFVNATIDERTASSTSASTSGLPSCGRRAAPEADITELELVALRAGSDPADRDPRAAAAGPGGTQGRAQHRGRVDRRTDPGHRRSVRVSSARSSAAPREQLRASFRLPDPRSRAEGARRARPPAFAATTLARRGGGLSDPSGDAGRSRRWPGSSSILITSPSASEGKTTTAINLAESLALAGSKVILMECDLRKPEIGATLGMSTDRGVIGVLLGDVRLEDALMDSPLFGSDLKLLLAEQAAPFASEILSLASSRNLIEDGLELADYVIIDSAPLSEVVDALPLAASADQVLLVVLLGKTRLGQITELGELLVENGITPAGFALLGAQQVSKGYYYDQGRRLRRDQPAAVGPDAAAK